MLHQPQTQQMPTIRRECKSVENDNQVLALKHQFMEIAQRYVPNFKIDDENREVIANLFNYFNGWSGAYDLKKGLWLAGDIGTGKSTLMYLFSEYLKSQQNGFKIHICSRISTDYATNGNLDEYTYNSAGYCGKPVSMCFDELGRETIPANHFGQRLNVVQHIMHVRYSLWQQHGLKTFVTTNCDPSQVELLYGDFVRDRIREMFNIVVLQGKSRRC